MRLKNIFWGELGKRDTRGKLRYFTVLLLLAQTLHIADKVIR